MSGRSRLLVLSGPSGVGKTTVAAGLLRDPRFGRAVTATTRAPRPGERHGRDYLFLSREAFLEGVAAGRFLEHAEVHGHLYGTPRASVEQVLATGRICLLVIDVQGAATLRERGTDARFVFLAPPSPEELERRLRSRGSEDEATVERRLAQARIELARQGEYDTVVLNEDLEQAIGDIAGLALAPEGRDATGTGTDPRPPEEE